MRANTDNEESELEYNGPEILESLRETLLAPRNPIEPVINAAKSVVDLLPDFMNTKTERGSHLANEDQVTDSFDFNTDEGSDNELDNVPTVPAPVMAQTSSWSPPQALNPQPFFASTAAASISTEESAENLSTCSDAKCTAWDIPATIPGIPYASQLRNSGHLGTSQIDGMSVAAWTQPMDLPKSRTRDSSGQNFMQQPFQQFLSIGAPDQNTFSVTDHFEKQNSMGEASGWTPGNTTYQNPDANGDTADTPHTNLLDRTAAISFIPELPFLGQIGFGAMSYQPDAMGSFQQPDDQIWAQPHRDQAQEQRQQFLLPTDAPFIAPEDAASTHLRLDTEQYGSRLDDLHQQQSPEHQYP
uniref:Uncharacterized protein n=4 Tax=Pyricularia oryzae TaxID=318829 RepID=Q2KG36_PYRO7|nr:hypothetical protein MGCH7_ch7g499 [Pyricularia oryzae 70-15]